MTSQNFKFALMMNIFAATQLLLAQAPDEQSAQAKLKKLVAMQRAWGVKASSAGATLDLKEFSRVVTNGRTVVKYRMVAFGLPKNNIYSLVFWLTGSQPQTNLPGVTLDESGLAICAGTSETKCGTPDKPNDPIDLEVEGGLGEVKRVALISADQSARAYASVVPFPVRGVDKACTVEATLITPNAEAVALSAKGFKPGATLDVEGVSEGEKQTRTGKTDENGTYEWVLLPAKKGLDNGRIQLSVHSDSCNPSLSFAWGKGSYALQ